MKFAESLEKNKIWSLKLGEKIGRLKLLQFNYVWAPS